MAAIFYANRVDQAGPVRIYNYDRDTRQFAPTADALGEIARDGIDVVLRLGSEVGRFIGSDGTVQAASFTDSFPGIFPRVELVREDGIPQVFGGFTAQALYSRKFEDGPLPTASSDRLNLTAGAVWNAAKLVTQGYRAIGFNPIFRKLRLMRGRAAVGYLPVLAANDGLFSANNGLFAVSLEVSTAPINIPGVLAWLRPDDLPASGAVEHWADCSGHGYHFNALAGTTVVGTGPNGFRCATFSDSSLVGPNLSPTWVFMVLRFDNTSSDDAAILGHHSSHDWFGGQTSDEELDHILSSVHSSAAIETGSLNGVSTDPILMLKSTSFKLLEFGGTATAVNRLGTDRDIVHTPYSVVEVILGSGSLSGGDRTAIYNYMQRYNLF